MSRLGLIEEKEEVLLPEEGFILSNETGVDTVSLLSIIGKGGTAIAYKGIRRKNGDRSTCIVKEYFPEDKAEDRIYIRNKTGEEISILEKYREAELKLQQENIQRELKTNQDIFFRDEDVRNKNFNNFPYIYKAEYFGKFGDSSYIVLDSSEGETLHVKMRNGIENETSVIRYVYQLLAVVEHLHRRGFVHCDIKPENLWIRGGEDNQSMCLLDFGSAFRLKDYQVDLNGLSDDEIMREADRIIRNESLGSSTDGYRSFNIAMVENHKRLYASTDYSPSRGKKLISAVNAIGIKDDLYSVVKVMEQLFQALPESTSRLIFAEELQYIQDKNANEGYGSVEDLREDISIIETIIHKGAHSKVLQRGLDLEVENITLDDFDENLLCEVN